MSPIIIPLLSSVDKVKNEELNNKKMRIDKINRYKPLHLRSCYIDGDVNEAQRITYIDFKNAVESFSNLAKFEGWGLKKPKEERSKTQNLTSVRLFCTVCNNEVFVITKQKTICTLSPFRKYPETQEAYSHKRLAILIGHQVHVYAHLLRTCPNFKLDTNTSQFDISKQSPEIQAIFLSCFPVTSD